MATETMLKPCPCCGGEAEIQNRTTPIKRKEKFPNREYEYRVVCGDDYDLMTDWYPTPEAAAEAWNHREGEDMAYEKGYNMGLFFRDIIMKSLENIDLSKLSEVSDGQDK